MNTLDPHMILLHSGLRYRDEASGEDWARVVQAFALFCGKAQASQARATSESPRVCLGETVISRDEPAGSI